MIWQYLRQSKIFFLVSAMIFIVSIILGIVFQPDWLSSYINEMIKSLVGQIKGMDFFQLLVFIFKNNLTVSIFGMFLGIGLAIYPISILIVNGYFIGFVVSKAFGVEGFGAILSLLPHGIFEIPALLIALGLGIKIGFIMVFNFVRYCERNKSAYWIFILAIFPLALFVVLLIFSLSDKTLRKKLAYELKNCSLVLIYVILPLLIVAAIIETSLIFLI